MGIQSTYHSCFPKKKMSFASHAFPGRFRGEKRKNVTNSSVLESVLGFARRKRFALPAATGDLWPWKAPSAFCLLRTPGTFEGSRTLRTAILPSSRDKDGREEEPRWRLASQDRERSRRRGGPPRGGTVRAGARAHPLRNAGPGDATGAVAAHVLRRRGIRGGARGDSG